MFGDGQKGQQQTDTHGMKRSQGALELVDDQVLLSRVRNSLAICGALVAGICLDHLGLN